MVMKSITPPGSDLSTILMFMILIGTTTTHRDGVLTGALVLEVSMVVCTPIIIILFMADGTIHGIPTEDGMATTHTGVAIMVAATGAAVTGVAA